MILGAPLTIEVGEEKAEPQDTEKGGPRDYRKII